MEGGFRVWTTKKNGAVVNLNNKIAIYLFITTNVSIWEQQRRGSCTFIEETRTLGKPVVKNKSFGGNWEFRV